MLSLTPLRRIMKDYFIVCETYYQAIRTAPPSRIQAIDMGRRALHDEGSRVLIERLKGKITRRPRHGAAAVHADLRAALERVRRGGAGGDGLPGAVLFACTMNAVRSPMAAAILRHLVGRRVYVESAGVRAGGPDAFAVAVMDEIGIDISQHTPRTLRDLHDTSFDLIVTLSPEAHHQALELTRTMAVDVEYWPTFDATHDDRPRQPRADPAGLPRRARRPVPAHQAALRPRGRADSLGENRARRCQLAGSR